MTSSRLRRWEKKKKEKRREKKDGGSKEKKRRRVPMMAWATVMRKNTPEEKGKRK